jgi:hypothetical protein
MPDKRRVQADQYATFATVPPKSAARLRHFVIGIAGRNTHSGLSSLNKCRTVERI